jgi:hypothetical protein
MREKLYGRKSRQFVDEKNYTNTINSKSDSSKSCFWVFYSITNTPNKKTPKYKIPGYPRFPDMGLQSQIFVEIVRRFCQQSGQLWKQISWVLFGFRSAH